MAKRVNTKKKTKINRPRSKSRGWLVLGRRWQRWLKEFRVLISKTLQLTIQSINWDKVRAVGLVVIGLVFVGLWLDHYWQKESAERIYQKEYLSKQLEDIRIYDLPHPTNLTIGSMVNVAVKDGYVAYDNWTLFDNEAVYVVDSARPGTNGNIIIYGHNTREVMGNIRALRGGEIITLALSDGSKRDYSVLWGKQVLATAVEYLTPSQTEMLTMYTCDGLGDTKRFIVRAVPVTE